METDKKNSNIGLWYGLIAGLVICITTLIQYLAGIETYLGPIGFLTYVVLIVIAVLAGLKQKKLNGGYLKFNEALKVTFSVFASALLLQTLFTYVLLNYIDIPFKEALAQETMNRTEDFLRKLGTSDSVIDETMEEATKKDPFSFGNMILGYAFWCILWFLVSLTISAIIKKNQPVFPTT